MRGMLTAFERLGFDSATLLAAGGLKQSDLDNPDASISSESFGAIFACAHQQRPIRNLGLHLAAATDLGAYPLVDYLVLTSDSVGAGLKQLARYFHLIGAPATLELRDAEEPPRVLIHSNPFGVEYSTALNLLHLRRETEGRFEVLYISFAHQPEDLNEFESMLQCRVLARQPWSGLVISRTAWDLPLRRRDPILRATLETCAKEIAARLPATDAPVASISRVLASRVAGGDTRIASVARELGTSIRTLQRRLSAIGLSYQDLLDRTRCEAAHRYLSHSALSIGEIAWLLGYSEPSAFHRAFKRWNGASPQSFRANRSARAVG